MSIIIIIILVVGQKHWWRWASIWFYTANKIYAQLISLQAWYHDGDDDDDDDDDDVEWCEVVWDAYSKDQFWKNPRLSVWLSLNWTLTQLWVIKQILQ